MDVFGAVVEQARGALRSAAWHAAVELGLPEAWSQGGQGVESLSRAVGGKADKLQALLDVLVLEGALAREGGVDGEPSYAFVAPLADVGPPPPREGWGRLAEVIRSGRPLSSDSPEILKRYHEHLRAVGAAAASELAASWLAPAGDRLLDAGGGLGTYSAAYLRARASGRAVLLDRPEVVALARASLGELADRVDFAVGEIATAALTGAFDVALLANVLHLHGPDVNQSLVRRVSTVLRPGGPLVVKDARLDADRRGPASALYFSLNLALYTEAGRLYTNEELAGWLREAGLDSVRSGTLESAPEATVLVASRGP